MCKSDCEKILTDFGAFFKSTCSNQTYLAETAATLDKAAVCSLLNDNAGCVKIAALTSGANVATVSFGVLAAALVAMAF